ncbi:hypothetical protein Hanom_Chr13g01238121 [Helianthus anomalus]
MLLILIILYLPGIQDSGSIIPPNRPPPNPTQIPIARGHPQQSPRGLVYSSLCPVLAAIASYIGNRVYTNFPYDDSSIPVSLSQPESVPETHLQDVGGSSSKNGKKRSHKKKTDEEIIKFLVMPVDNLTGPQLTMTLEMKEEIMKKYNRVTFM